MNIQKIKELSSALKKEVDGLIFVEKEVTDLLLAVSDFIVKNMAIQGESDLPSHFISLKDFLESNYFISKRTMLRYCAEDHDFREKYTRFSRNRWYIDEKGAYNFLKSRIIYKKRIERFEKFREKLASCNK